jgi:hypothetical protein
MLEEAKRFEEEARIFAAELVGLPLDVAITRAEEGRYYVREVSPRTKPPGNALWGLPADGRMDRITLFASQDLVVSRSESG